MTLLVIGALIVIAALIYDNRAHITHDDWEDEE